MNSVLKDLLAFADHIGAVDEMHCYDKGYLTVGGKTRSGETFTITLRFEEEKKDGN